MGDINVILHEAISGIRIVKAFQMEGYEEKRFADNSANFYKNLFVHDISNILQGISSGIELRTTERIHEKCSDYEKVRLIPVTYGG